MCEDAGEENGVDISVRWSPVPITCDYNAENIRMVLTLGEVPYTEQNINANP